VVAAFAAELAAVAQLQLLARVSQADRPSSATTALSAIGAPLTANVVLLLAKARLATWLRSPEARR
jgi:hypothetical protein